MDIKNPHDKFFRSYFGQKDHLESFLAQALPPPVFRLLDFGTLEIETTTHIDPAHKEHFSDLSASVQILGRPWKIYILVEHKSYHDPFASLQILRYMVQQWNRDVQDHPRSPLTPIIPVLFYHGPQRHLPDQFLQLFPQDLPPELQAYLPDYRCQIFNLTAQPDPDLPQDPLTQGVLWAMKYTRTQIQMALKALDRLVDTLGDEILTDPWFQALGFYLLASTTLTPAEIFDTITTTLKNFYLRENLMSTYQALIEKGKAEGIAIGEIRGKLEGKTEAALQIARELKHQRLALEMIARATGLSLEELQKL